MQSKTEYVESIVVPPVAHDSIQIHDDVMFMSAGLDFTLKAGALLVSMMLIYLVLAVRGWLNGGHIKEWREKCVNSNDSWVTVSFSIYQIVIVMMPFLLAMVIFK